MREIRETALPNGFACVDHHTRRDDVEGSTRLMCERLKLDLPPEQLFAELGITREPSDRVRTLRITDYSDASAIEFVKREFAREFLHHGYGQAILHKDDGH